ncbi:MAG: septal ring lytic transglycosylase RlpA family protein [Candidatus Melainabacteria bacterium]|nr:septal ring lytic transglycosylase RlpA family protein [Candidatus Melainabacteria bacterium]
MIAVVPVTGLTALKADAASVAGIASEVEASVWQDGNAEVATVTLNGKELVSFKAEAGAGAAAEKAEDLAAKLKELLEDKHVNLNELLPARAGNVAAIQCAGNTVLSVEPPDSSKHLPDELPSPIELSWKIVNGIRTALGSPALPASFFKIEAVPEETSSRTYSQDSAFSGQASWYGPRFHGRRTADGHRFDQDKLTAAHRSLPFGTKLLVMNRKTGNSCVVEINDRGPFVGNRIIDLSRGAARQLNMISSGVAVVDCLVLGNE